MCHMCRDQTFLLLSSSQCTERSMEREYSFTFFWLSANQTLPDCTHSSIHCRSFIIYPHRLCLLAAYLHRNMSGNDIFRNPLVMDRVCRFLGESDLNSLATSSDAVRPTVDRILDARKNATVTVLLGEGEMPPLTRFTKTVNVHLTSGPFNSVLARRQLMRVRHISLNLLVDFHFKFTADVTTVLTECNLVVNEIKVSPCSLWTLHTKIRFDDIQKLCVRPEPDVYERGLLRLIGNNSPTEIQIPADYLDFPEMLPALERTTRLTISEPRQHVASGNRFLGALSTIRTTLTHLDVRVTSCAAILVSSGMIFPTLRKLSITGDEIYLDGISVLYPSLQTLEIRHPRNIHTSELDKHFTLRKLRLVLRGEPLLSCSNMRPLFPSMTTIEIDGQDYTSDSLDAFFEHNTAEKVTIGGRILSPERFDSSWWISRLGGCKELRIVPDVWFGKLNWDQYVGRILKLRKLELLHLCNFEGVSPLELRSMTVEDCQLRCDFKWPWTCIRSYVVQAGHSRLG